MDRIKFYSGYKYQLAEDYKIQTSITPSLVLSTKFIFLTPTGFLNIYEGYAWDGATGVPDGIDILRGSVVHDALYQLMRSGLLDCAEWRDRADRELQAICIEDGMAHVFSEFVYQGVHLLGNPFADPKNMKQPSYSPPKEITVENLATVATETQKS